MKKFFRLHLDPRPLWLIERKRKVGTYHNSPLYWHECGYIRARDVQSALVKACFAVGSSMVRVTPEDEI